MTKTKKSIMLIRYLHRQSPTFDTTYSWNTINRYFCIGGNCSSNYSPDSIKKLLSEYRNEVLNSKSPVDLNYSYRMKSLQGIVASIASKNQLGDLGKSLCSLKGGVFLSMQLRNDLRNSKKDFMNSEHIHFSKDLDEFLKSWLHNVFCIDSLTLLRITFEHSSGTILEKVARGESVHRVRSLSELKRRLDDGRRCYALFHHCLEEEPLVFVHIALTTSLSKSIKSLDLNKNELLPTHAIFYSINSPLISLSGLDLASTLIKETCKQLKKDFPTLTTFSTLSPVPGFRRWLMKISTNISFQLPNSIKEQLIEAINTNVHKNYASVNFQSTDGEIISLLNDIISDNTNNIHKSSNNNNNISNSNNYYNSWVSNESLSNKLKHPLLWLCTIYLTTMKKSVGGKYFPLDDVARFHLRNGASLHSINWMGKNKY